jgi:hypothetical protein
MVRIRCDHDPDDEDSFFFGGESAYFDIPDDQVERGKAIVYCPHGDPYLFRGHTFIQDRDGSVTAEEGTYYLWWRDDAYTLWLFCAACSAPTTHPWLHDLDTVDDSIHVPCDRCGTYLTVRMDQVPFAASAGRLALNVWEAACSEVRQLDAFTECSPDSSAQAFFGPVGVLDAGRVVSGASKPKPAEIPFSGQLDALRTLQEEYESKLQNLPAGLHADAKRLYERERRKIMGTAAE